MTTALRTLVLTVVAMLLVGVATAQDFPRLDSADAETPPEGFTMMPYDTASPVESSDASEESMVVGPVQSTVDSMVESDGTCGCNGSGPSAYDLWDLEPVPIESTGTWLKRGLWFAEADVMVLMRQWSRHSLTLVSQDGQEPPFTSFNRLLILQRAHPGQDATVRATLGRYLFRDIDNRDHTAEFTVYTGGNWVQNQVLGSPDGQLQVPFPIDGNNTSFDNSTRDEVHYNSRFNSFELNYHVERRMDRDQMVMDPNGGWTRMATPGFSREFLVGIRYFQMQEHLNWMATDVQVAGNDGQYLIDTNNELIGLQLGAGETYETSRWSAGISAKGGAYANHASDLARLNFTIDDTADFDHSAAEDKLSFIGESSLDLKYHLTPNFSLRTGLHLLYVTAIAEAPFQVNFLSDTNALVTSGNPFYFGVTAGFEGYW